MSTSVSSPRAGRSGAERSLIGLLVVQAVCATGGGAAMVYASAVGKDEWFPSAWLDHIPFDSLLWPGLILGIGLGVSAGAIGWGVLRRPRWGPFTALTRWTGQHWSWTGTLGLGTGLMAWIVVQRLVLPDISWLQPTFFTVGAALVVLALLPGVRRSLAIPPIPRR